MRRCRDNCFSLTPLEKRIFLSVTPSSVLTKAMRQEIIDHWVGSNKSTLQTKLNTGNGAFDSSLLGYMTARAGTSGCVAIPAMKSAAVLAAGRRTSASRSPQEDACPALDMAGPIV